MNWKKTLIFILFFLAGVVAGTLLTEVLSRVDFLSWLCASQSVGVGYPTPIVVDLSVIRFSFGVGINVNLIKVISIVLCLWASQIFARRF